MPLECPGVLQTIIRRSLVPAGPRSPVLHFLLQAHSPLHSQWALPASGELTSRGPWRNLFWMFCLCCSPTWNPNSLLTFESRLFLRFKSIQSSLRPSWLAGCQAWAGKCPARRGCKDGRPQACPVCPGAGTGETGECRCSHAASLQQKGEAQPPTGSQRSKA